jgi:uncharacterized protein YbjT (DUF2867 family)
MYVISGATGHIGSVIAHNLLDKKEKVRVIGRNKEKLKPFEEKGAEAAVGSLDDPAFLKKAYKGATALFQMEPPHYTSKDMRNFQRSLGKAAKEAIQSAGVQYVVHLSSMGAHLAEGVGPVSGLHDVEGLLNETGASIIHLRPVFFMENFYSMIPLIKQFQIIAMPIRPDVSFPMIATRDIADVATKTLLAHHWKGKVTRELLGPRTYTGPEVAAILGQAIGQKINYLQGAPEEARKGMVGAGLSENVADLFIEMYGAIDSGRMSPTEKRTAENTAPTTLEEFAKTFAGAYKSG